jgi:NitT/TauT family transport system substrate-binding protein
VALKIMPHGRLQEWVADEKGYFAAEGLDYSFVTGGDYGIHSVARDGAGEIKTGAWTELRSLFPASGAASANYDEVVLAG